MSPRQHRVTGRARTERPNIWFRVGMAGAGYPAGAVFKLRFANVANIPRTGGAILAANHISYADPLVVGRYVYDSGRLPRYLAKDSLFELPAVGRVMRGMGQVPVHRGGPEAREALESAVAALRRGELIIVYPEGTVTRDPNFWPRPGKTGVARLSLLAPEIPVIPVGQWGAQTLDVYHKRVQLFPRAEAHVTSGPPLDLSEFRARVPNPNAPSTDVLRGITRTIMGAVTELVAQLRGEEAPVRRRSSKPPPVSDDPSLA